MDGLQEAIVYCQCTRSFRVCFSLSVVVSKSVRDREQSINGTRNAVTEPDAFSEEAVGVDEVCTLQKGLFEGGDERGWDS